MLGLPKRKSKQNRPAPAIEPEVEDATHSA
jgi:hypothetical protein